MTSFMEFMQTLFDFQHSTWIPWNLSFHYILFFEKRIQMMLWHHNARVNSYQRWKQTRIRVCFHLWCELTNAMRCNGMTSFMKFLLSFPLNMATHAVGFSALSGSNSGVLCFLHIFDPEFHHNGPLFADCCVWWRVTIQEPPWNLQWKWRLICVHLLLAALPPSGNHFTLSSYPPCTGRL